MERISTVLADEKTSTVRDRLTKTRSDAFKYRVFVRAEKGERARTVVAEGIDSTVVTVHLPVTN